MTTPSEWTHGAAGWVHNERYFDAIFAPITAAIVGAADLSGGQRALDVGCGSGTLLAAAAAAGADPVGIDISPDMVARARERVPSGTVVLGDAATTDFAAQAPGPPFDRVLSRFGVMFFADPTAAFARIGDATSSTGTLTFACWRSGRENPIFTLGTEVLTTRLGEPPVETAEGAPGPTAFADPNRLTAILESAGWSSVRAEPLDTVCDYAIDESSDGVAERLSIMLATTTGRRAESELRPRLGETRWQSLLDDVRADLRTHLVDGRLQHPAACWLVTAAR